MMEGITIREACIEDAEKYIGYFKQIGGESDNLTFDGNGIPITVEEEEKFIEGIVEDERSVMYIAIKDGEIVGDISISGMPRRMSHRAELGIAVTKAYWNSGVGSALMQAVIDYAKNHGIEIINLEVRADNVNAIHLYEKFGFKTCGTSPAFFKIGDEYVDFKLMYLDLR